MKYDLFISYSRKDFNEVSALKKFLESRLPGLKCWFDLTGIESGDEFTEKDIDAINHSQSILFFISDNSLNSKSTKKEIIYAYNMNKKIVPVLLKGAQLKGWFSFLQFKSEDCIDSTDELQMNKLQESLASWIKMRAETEAQTIKPEKELSAAEMCNLGIEAFCQEAYKEANGWYRKAAAKGDTEAMYYLGYNYSIGKGVPQDFEKSNEWYRKAAELGDVHCMWLLGYNYTFGYGTPQDYKEANKWYLKAAEKGDITAMFSLSYSYAHGRGIAKDLEKSKEWRQKAEAEKEKREREKENGAVL